MMWNTFQRSFWQKNYNSSDPLILHRTIPGPTVSLRVQFPIEYINDVIVACMFPCKVRVVLKLLPFPFTFPIMLSNKFWPPLPSFSLSRCFSGSDQLFHLFYFILHVTLCPLRHFRSVGIVFIYFWVLLLEFYDRNFPSWTSGYFGCINRCRPWTLVPSVCLW